MKRMKIINLLITLCRFLYIKYQWHFHKTWEIIDNSSFVVDSQITSHEDIREWKLVFFVNEYLPLQESFALSSSSLMMVKFYDKQKPPRCVFHRSLMRDEIREGNSFQNFIFIHTYNEERRQVFYDKLIMSWDWKCLNVAKNS